MVRRLFHITEAVRLTGMGCGSFVCWVPLLFLTRPGHRVLQSGDCHGQRELPSMSAPAAGTDVHSQLLDVLPLYSIMCCVELRDDDTLQPEWQAGVSYLQAWDGSIRDGHVVHVSVPRGVCTTAEDLHLRILPQVHEDIGDITTTCGTLYSQWLLSACFECDSVVCF